VSDGAVTSVTDTRVAECVLSMNERKGTEMSASIWPIEKSSSIAARRLRPLSFRVRQTINEVR
jgi:hypothetical protein